MRARLVIAAWSLAAALAACTSPQKTTPPVAPQPPPAAKVEPLNPPLPEGPVKIGLLLPLSGDTEAIGQDMLDAAQLALFEVAGDDLVLVPRDSGTSDESAVAAARELLDSGAKLLIGPLFGQATKAVSPLAAQRKVAVLSFSNDASVAGNGTFILGFRPEEQVTRIVDYARRQGLDPVAALAPDDAYGMRAVRAWRAVVSPTGETVAAPADSAFYPAEGSDASEVVRRFTRIDARAAGSTDGTVAEPPPFRSLLLPDGGLRLQTVLGLLAYYDVGPANTRFLGTTRWQEDPRLRQEPALQGGWLAGPSPSDVAAFSRYFDSVYGRPAGSLAALAYDATALAAVLVRDKRRLDPEVLTAPEGFAGKLGLFRLLPSGVSEHGLAVIEFGQGPSRVLDPAPVSFETAPVPQS
ncbi:MAG: penicillin-binding protein activator [Geminicoccaceae bacterium]